jgi:DNA-3-methyladenine glycosylase
MNREPMPQSFYDRDVVQVARDLLGMLLVRQTDEGTTIGRLVETEAYLAQGDTANHAHRGMTRRNATMFGPPGHAYVYAIHARFCLNAVTEPEDVASAVLLRAVEPLAGVDLMRARRRLEAVRKGVRPPRFKPYVQYPRSESKGSDPFSDSLLDEVTDLARGPARLCEAFAVDRTLDGWDLTRGERLWLTGGEPVPPAQVATTTRIGVTSAKDLVLRFHVAGSPFVSGPKQAGVTF